MGTKVPINKKQHVKKKKLNNYELRDAGDEDHYK